MLQLILRELPAAQGVLNTVKDISYSSQEAFLFPDTIRSNIMFNEELDVQRLFKIYQNCALEKDIQSFPQGDCTYVGDQGSALSGGQRARVNLARCIYKQAQLYLFDDPLSAVDARVGRHIFDNVMGPNGMLADKTRILVTHQVQYLNQADLIIILKNGEIQAIGSWQEMQPQINEEFGTLNQNQIDETLQAVEASGNGMQQKAAVQPAKTAEKAEMQEKTDNDEDQTEGSVPWSVWLAYFRAGSGPMGLLGLAFILFASQFVCSYADYFVNIYTKIQCQTSCVVTYSILIAAAVIVSS